MGYATGSASSPADIISAIVAACTAMGWTHSSLILSKGDCHTRLTSPDGLNQLRVEGANDAGFVVACPWDAWVAIDAWPVSYRIWVNEDPDACFVHIRQADHVTYQHIMFGVLEDKVGDWVGGNFFSASRTAAHNTDYDAVGVFSGSNSQYHNLGVAGGPFIGGDTSYTLLPSADGLHCELPGYYGANVWVQSADNASGIDSAQWPRFLNPINRWQPNLWNGQAVLFRPHLYLTQPGGRWAKIGSLPHLRSLRITNYEPYDIITLGEEQWMVAPWTQKNTVQIDGNGQLEYKHSGTHGFAVRYTP